MIEFDQGVLTDAQRETLATEAEQHAAFGGLGTKVQILIGTLRRGATPATLALAVGALSYLVLTFDAVPDFLPGVGLADDLGVLAGAVKVIRRLVS